MNPKSDMGRLPPIPTPASQRWRELRVKVMPVILFVGTALIVAHLWKDNLAAPTLIGEVEAIRAIVSSPKAGTLAQLNIERLQPVRAGDPIAQVITTDPRVLQSSLAVVQAEIELLRLSLRPSLDEQRFALTYDRLRLDWMDQRVQLATAKVKLQLASNELRRTEELFNQQIASATVLDQAKTLKDQLESEIEERSRLVAEQEKSLDLVQPPAAPENPAFMSNHEKAMQASLKLQEEKLRLAEAELSPITLTVPIDGTISAIHRRSGEAVLAGEPIVTVTTTTSDRIVGYMRQPLAFEPKVGMCVEVRAHSLNRSVGQAQITGVGSQFEPIAPTLLPLANGRVQEMGLPILVNLPPTQKLLPGEIVDLIIRP